MTSRALACIALLSMSCAAASPSSGNARASIAATESDACARCRAAFDACGGAGAPCDDGCERQQHDVREGFMPAFAGCIERTAKGDACERIKQPAARRDLVRVCYYAAVELLAERDHGASLDALASAICGRRSRCAGLDEAATKSCRADITTRPSVDGKLLSVVRRDSLDALVKCIAARPCDEEDPAAACGHLADRSTP